MKKFLIAIVLTVSSINVYSQCATDQIKRQLIKDHPEIDYQKGLDAFNAGVVEVGNAKRATKYIIPVVFHVIHTYGPENISDAQIYDQIRILNEDYSYTNANKANIRTLFKSVAADCQIEFQLAKIDPQGNCTNGIDRVYSPLHVEVDKKNDGPVKSLSRWDNKKYLNIWVISSIKSDAGSSGTTLGYAYLPETVKQFGLNNLDGIIVRSDFVGSIGTADNNYKGRVLTHEIGHYLNLDHTFDDQNGCSGTDYCADTPPVSNASVNQNCPANGNSCDTDVPDLIDQWENYMDYAYGSCQAMFTLNQKSRMHSALTNYTFRANMVSNANLIATGLIKGNTTPVAFFTSTSKLVCVGEPVTYYDMSCKANVDSKVWSFTGANITDTNKDTPVVFYSTPGRYKVSLTVTNTNGSNTLAVDNYIEVRPNAAIDKPTVVQSFEKSTWNIGTGWSIQNPNAGNSNFFRDSSTGYYSNACLKAPITSTMPIGQKFQIITPPVDLRPLKGKSPKISMMLAYVRKNTSSAEDIRIYISKGCSYDNWQQILYRNASFISYDFNSFSPSFKPADASQWKLITTSLNTYVNDSNISFMIEINSAQGNPVYIDNINIGEFNSAIENVEDAIGLNVYPNPSNDILNVSFSNVYGKSEIWLENIEGKRIDTVLEPTEESGDILVQYKRKDNIANGIYILKIQTNNQVINKKVIFAN